MSSLENYWNIAFGIKQPIEQTDVQAEKIKKHNGARMIVGTSKIVRQKLDQEILDLLNQGIDTNEEIYDILEQSGKLPNRDGMIMAFSTIVCKIQKVRRKNGLSKREKQPKIIAMLTRGIDKKTIINELKISRSYLCQVIKKTVGSN